MPDLNLQFRRRCEPRQRYKLLFGLVIPRPIALVTTFGPTGIVNAAPFSFFNVFTEAPPLIVLGLQPNRDGTPKDTSRNIRVNGRVRGQPGRRGARGGHEHQRDRLSARRE